MDMDILHQEAFLIANIRRLRSSGCSDTYAGCSAGGISDSVVGVRKRCRIRKLIVANTPQIPQAYQSQSGL